MKLKPKSAPPGYMVRKSPDDSEHGPFTLEHLRDLAEFGHLNSDSLVRSEDSGEYAPLRETPDLLRNVFPERTRMTLGQWKGDKTAEDGCRPVDTRGIRECDPAAEDTGLPPAPPDRRGAPSSGALRLKSDPAAAEDSTTSRADSALQAFQAEHELKELGHLLKRARDKDTPELEADHRGTVSRVLLVARWTIMAVLTAAGVGVWLGVDPASMSAFDVVIDFLIGLVLVSFGFLFILPEALRLFAAPLTGFTDALILGSARETRNPDHTAAERFLKSGDREAALREYRHLVARFPRDLTSYLKAIRLCREMGREKEARKFHDKALRHIRGKQDRNLFLGSVRRMDVERASR